MTTTTLSAQELRIGNWVLDHNGEAKKVAYVGDTIGLDLGYGATQKYQKAPIFSGDVNDLQPIPLTPEILEKAGFESRKAEWENGYYAFLFPITIYLENGSVVRCVMLHKECQPPCEYLHQLQNLYFAMTGTELKIDL